MHFTEPQLQTYYDGETPQPEQERVATHLQTCPACQTTLQLIETRTTRADTLFATLDPTPAESIPSSRAFPHLHQKLYKEPKMSTFLHMLQKLFSPKMRPALATTLIIAFFGIALSLPSFRAAAIDFLGLFRVQQIEVVEFNPANLPENMEGNFRQMDQIIANELKVEEAGDPIDAADAVEASKLAGFDVILPSSLDAESRLTVQPATTASFTVDLVLWQTILEEMGRSDIQLPEELDGQTITLSTDRSVTYAAGNCLLPTEQFEEIPYGERDCTVLIQTPSPSVDAPANLPLDELGQAALRFLGMSASEAARFSEKIDWTTTLIVPVPTGSNYQEVTIQGVVGTVFFDRYGEYGSNYHLMWVKDGIVYALSGPGTVADAVELANSLK